MADQILTLSDPEVAQHIDFIETNREGIYIHFRDGNVEFHSWRNSKITT